MNKKSPIIIFIICVAAILSSEINLRANQTNDDISYIETKTVDGFSIGITDYYGLTNTPTDRGLCFSIWTTNEVGAANQIIVTNAVSVIFPTQPENAYQVELFDTNGVAIPKTEVGKKAGSKFFDFNTNSFVVWSTGGYSGPGGWFGVKVKSQREVVTTKAREPQGQMHIIFRPSDLFMIDKPGNYKLRISFQIIAFPRTGPNRGEYKTELIRFPPLDYPLTKR